MANYETLKSAIQDVVKTNGNNEITGALLQQTLLAMINTLGAGYQFMGVIPKLTYNPGTPDPNVFYIADKNGTYPNFAGLNVYDNEICLFVYNGEWQKHTTNIQSTPKVTELLNAIQDLNGNKLYITDKDGYIIAQIDTDGIKSVDFEAQGKKLSLTPDGNVLLTDFYKGVLYITDANGYVVMYVDASGIHSVGIEAQNMLPNSWFNKVIATYGDSVTAVNNGDFVKPIEPISYNWGNEVAKFFSFAKHYGRGIGSTTYKWNTSGGQIAWCRTLTGQYVDRNDSYTYDNYQGHVTIPQDCTPIRGDGCSWLRIKTMFPESIKNTIDVVLVMFHNDFHQDMQTDVVWVPNDTTDPEWAESEFYNTYGGDFNISSVQGGIASTVMKIQAWMPQALIILMTPISGVYVNGYADNKDLENPESEKMKQLAEVVKDIAFRMSTPCIDNYGNDGINSLNKTIFITDGIHPYSIAGRKKVGRSVISGLMRIISNL